MASLSKKFVIPMSELVEGNIKITLSIPKVLEAVYRAQGVGEVELGNLMQSKMNEIQYLLGAEDG